MTITALPAAPSRSDTPANFITKADAFVAALAVLVTEMNLAIASANQTKWISGTTYAIGDEVWSPADFQGYRRKTAGAGTTDPSADSTNWQRTEVSETSLQNQTYTAYTTAGTSTAYTLTPTPAVAALAENQEFDVEFHTGAGATPTLAISGGTAKNLKYRDSAGAKQAVTLTQIPSGWRSRVVYDGTDYIVREVPPPGAQIQPISASVGSSALTISASALSLDFRSATLGSGTVSTVSGAPANLVISSGSTLGTVSGQPSRIAVLAINNAGTIELAAVNVAGGAVLDESGVISTTAEGGAGAADSVSAIYSTTARAGVAYRVLGYIESTQATAGTWATAPSLIQGAGGMAMASRINLLPTQATTSGTFKDFTIPTGAKRIVVTLSGVSTNGTSDLILRLGDSGGIDATNYSGATYGGQTSGTPAFQANSTGISLSHAAIVAAGDVLTGKVIFDLQDATTHVWSGHGAVYRTGGTASFSQVLGQCDLGSECTTLRLTTANGTDAFDVGVAGVSWQ